MAAISLKHFGHTHRLSGSSHLLLPVSLYCFRLTTAIFLLEINVLLAALAVPALIYLKIQLKNHLRNRVAGYDLLQRMILLPFNQI